MCLVFEFGFWASSLCWQYWKDVLGKIKGYCSWKGCGRCVGEGIEWIRVCALV